MTIHRFFGPDRLMRSTSFGFLLLTLSAAYFVLRQTTGLGEGPLFRISYAAFGIVGVLMLLAGLVDRLDRRLNRFPKAPFFVVNGTRCSLVLDSDGSYESCQQFLETLAREFGAEYSVHLEAGPQPQCDKEKGYWNVTMFRQDFFVMRERGYGIYLWGPESSADTDGFRRVAAYFDTVEFKTWQRRVIECLTGRSSSLTQTQAG